MLTLRTINCQACENSNAEIEEPTDGEYAPFRVCLSCHARLLTNSLRPLEWYNLARKFWWNQFLLHDDFYDDDGQAQQPEDDVVDAELYPAPQLAEVSSDLTKLLDFSYTKWRLTDEILLAWKNQDQHSALNLLAEILTNDPRPAIAGLVLEIARKVFKDTSKHIVLQAWRIAQVRSISINELFRASIDCLPHQEAFDLSTSYLLRCTEGEQYRLLNTLAHFQTEDVVDWLEQNIMLKKPFTQVWGEVAACCQLSWLRIERWLDLGRPYSLSALDALHELASQRLALTKLRNVALLAPPDRHTLTSILQAYAKDDPVPRVTKKVEAILESTNFSLLIK